MTLNCEKVLALMGPCGPISQTIKGYEARPQQLSMTRDVVEAFNQNQIALIEAGTGTGKSLAYLLPAILWAVEHKERVVISTYTINLQEQLLHKDIPFLLRALQVDIKAVLVKGMGNYVCRRKLEDAYDEKRLMLLQEADELDRIQEWAHTSQEGSKTELPFMPSYSTWEKVGAEGDACNHIECPHYKSCFYFKARKEASDAQILIVNHHLLCADLASRKQNKGSGSQVGVLPSYGHLVIDEAHHLEDVATDYFAARITRWDLMRQLAKLSSDKKGSERSGKLTILRQKIVEQYLNKDNQGIAPVLNRLEIDLQAEKQKVNNQLQEAFQAVSNFLEAFGAKGDGQPFASGEDGTSDNSEQKWRLNKEIFQHDLWVKEVHPLLNELIITLKNYVQSLKGLEGALESLNDEKLNEKTKSLRFDIQAIAQRLQGTAETLSEFIMEELTSKTVRWLEKRLMKTLVNIHLVDAQLDISNYLAENLFKEFTTVILCSATLATKKSFEFIRTRLGITPELLVGRTIIEKIYPSPFNYRQQSLLVVPTDMPNPNDASFIKAACDRISDAIDITHGHAFILFTSFSMLKACHAKLSLKLTKEGYPSFVQGDDQRKTLLERFKETPRAVLFGTDSFWEGVDVVGDALRCVIIVKLPFKVPSEPIIQARTEAILAAGGDPFMEYAVPNAVVKFKQGFGRLIRKHTDRGCVICLDTRLINKGYGRFFLDSLPDCGRLFEKGEPLKVQMKEFYRKTYALTKKV